MTMDRLEMLTRREQLMEDIIALMNDSNTPESHEDLVAALCDLVCKNFPAE